VLRRDDGSEATAASVTTILGALPKELSYWGFKLGVAATLEVSGNEDVSLEEMYELAKKTDHAPYRALRKAANRGTDVHAVAETLLRDGRLDDLPLGTEASSGYVDALVKWHDAHDVASWEIVAVEAMLFSERHEYAGQCDLIAKRPDGVYVVGDWKTSKAVFESHRIQAIAYVEAAREMGLIPEGAEAEAWVVRLGADGQFETVRSTNTIEDFLAVKAVYELLRDKSKQGEAVDV
jgi:hypothetical protein